MNETQMNAAPDNLPDGTRRNRTGRNPARIVVAVDTSRHSLAALEEAAALAALMQAELESLFVEDINLLHLCGFPFCNQIGSYTATVRRIDNRGMERELRATAARLREETARIAQRVQVPWHFHVRRGAVVSELLEAAQSALLLGLGRTGLSRRKSLGSTAQAIVARTTRPLLILGETQHTQPPLVLVYTPDEAGKRSLEIALQLAPRYDHQLEIWLLPQSAVGTQHQRVSANTDDNGGAALAAELEAYRATYREAHEAELATTLVEIKSPGAIIRRLQNESDPLSQKSSAHTLILPNSQAGLLAHHDGPTVLVP